MYPYSHRALETKGLQRILPKGGMWGFFGWHLVQPSLDKQQALLAQLEQQNPVASNMEQHNPEASKLEQHNPVASKLERSIIITEGEYDCMAVAQSLSTLSDSNPMKHIPAISLPNGCNSLPSTLIPLLESFTKIYLWLDNDKSGQDASMKFVSKLGADRCVLVKPSANSEVNILLIFILYLVILLYYVY